MIRTKCVCPDLFKSLSGEGVFEGLLSPYNHVDSLGDLVEPGAYHKNLKEQGDSRPLLWQHQQDVPVGQLRLIDRPDGLYARGKFLLTIPEAQKAFALVQAGIVKGLSIGFQSMRDSIENGVRHLKEIRLFEGSIVTFPAEELAQITSVKSAADEDRIRRALLEFKSDIFAALTLERKIR